MVKQLQSTFIAFATVLFQCNGFPVYQQANKLSSSEVLPSNIHDPLTLLSMSNEKDGEKKGNFFSNFFQELDNFVDDATSRRLGAGQAFYGKRKSSFYGEGDTGKKKDPNVFDPTEDYRGPSSSGYFQWMPDEDGRMTPVTKMKGKNVERKTPSFWGSNDE